MNIEVLFKITRPIGYLICLFSPLLVYLIVYDSKFIIDHFKFLKDFFAYSPKFFIISTSVLGIFPFVSHFVFKDRSFRYMIYKLFNVFFARYLILICLLVNICFVILNFKKINSYQDDSNPVPIDKDSIVKPEPGMIKKSNSSNMSFIGGEIFQQKAKTGKKVIKENLIVDLDNTYSTLTYNFVGNKLIIVPDQEKIEKMKGHGDIISTYDTEIRKMLRNSFEKQIFINYMQNNTILEFIKKFPQTSKNIRINNWNKLNSGLLSHDDAIAFQKWNSNYMGQWAPKLLFTVSGIFNETILLKELKFEGRYRSLENTKGSQQQVSSPFLLTSDKFPIVWNLEKKDNLVVKKVSKNIIKFEIIFFPWMLDKSGKWEGHFTLNTSQGIVSGYPLEITTFNINECPACK